MSISSCNKKGHVHLLGVVELIYVCYHFYSKSLTLNNFCHRSSVMYGNFHNFFLHSNLKKYCKTWVKYKITVANTINENNIIIIIITNNNNSNNNKQPSRI